MATALVGGHAFGCGTGGTPKSQAWWKARPLLDGAVACRLIAKCLTDAGQPTPAGLGLLIVALLAPSLTGCNTLRQGAIEALLRQGHAAAIDCLQGERARSDGDELRCNDWSFVEARYLRTNPTAEPAKP